MKYKKKSLITITTMLVAVVFIALTCYGCQSVRRNDNPDGQTFNLDTTKEATSTSTEAESEITAMISDEVYDNSFADVSQDDACLMAQNLLGPGWGVVNVYKDTYAGFDAWTVTLMNENGKTKDVHVQGNDCFID